MLYIIYIAIYYLYCYILFILLYIIHIVGHMKNLSTDIQLSMVDMQEIYFDLKLQSRSTVKSEHIHMTETHTHTAMVYTMDNSTCRALFYSGFVSE